MSETQFIKNEGRRIAYVKTEGAGPGVIFFGGFMSDMTGTKATMLQDYCEQRGQAFIRFDYSGHGQSSEAFEDGTIGEWASDAIAVLDQVAEGPQVLVGSSMGGWIALLAARARPERLAGFLGIAAAPDFTEDLMWEGFSDEVKAELKKNGVFYEDNPYEDEPTPITMRLIEEGREHLVLRAPLRLACPVRLLQGMQDEEVPWELALKLCDHIEGE
ncbi:MAG: alpha/beta hydrolase, partial [Alphaproteobacteria bacterium]|nr:alpha/beta hydrolase [Alphaproteobacteria bacterium]